MNAATQVLLSALSDMANAVNVEARHADERRRRANEVEARNVALKADVAKLQRRLDKINQQTMPPNVHVLAEAVVQGIRNTDPDNITVDLVANLISSVMHRGVEVDR